MPDPLNPERRVDPDAKPADLTPEELAAFEAAFLAGEQAARSADRMAKRVAKAAVKAIVADLADHRGLGGEWDMIDGDVQRGIRKAWRRIVAEAVLAHLEADK